MNTINRIIMTSPVVTAQPCGCCKYGAVVYPCATHHKGMPKSRPDAMKHLPPWVWNDKSVGELLREKK